MFQYTSERNSVIDVVMLEQTYSDCDKTVDPVNLSVAVIRVTCSTSINPHLLICVTHTMTQLSNFGKWHILYFEYSMDEWILERETLWQNIVTEHSILTVGQILRIKNSKTQNAKREISKWKLNIIDT